MTGVNSNDYIRISIPKSFETERKWRGRGDCSAYRDLSHPVITHIWIERAESRSVSRDRIWIIQKSGIGISKKSRKGGRILLILPRKTENPNRIISKTRKTKIEPYQSRVDFARISITSEWTLILFLGFMKRIADSSPLRANTLISKRSIASFINEKP